MLNTTTLPWVGELEDAISEMENDIDENYSVSKLYSVENGYLLHSVIRRTIFYKYCLNYYYPYPT